MKGPVILVTGFGAFPGARQNPTALLMHQLAAVERRLARLGVKLERRVLPVVYDEIGPKLKGLIADVAPDAILHFGLAGRRRAISIETRAVNYMGVLHPDAAGRRVKNRSVLPEEPFARPARIPARQLDAVLRRAGVRSGLSNDAGDYVCNQTFYLSLAMAEGTNRRAGFIHVPKMPPLVLARTATLLIMALLPALRQPLKTSCAGG